MRPVFEKIKERNIINLYPSDFKSTTSTLLDRYMSSTTVLVANPPSSQYFRMFILWILQSKFGILTHKLIEEFVKSEKVQGILIIYFTHEA